MIGIRQAAFALRVVRRNKGYAGILYRRRLDKKGRERLIKISPVGPLAFSAGTSLLRAAIRANGNPQGKLTTGPFHPLNEDWGARVGCYALIASGLRNAERLHKAAMNLRYADGTEAAWWLGLMTRPGGKRAIRALRILTEAVK